MYNTRRQKAVGKLKLVKIMFSRLNFERGTEKDLRKLSGTARDLFYFTEEFGKLHNDCDNVYV